ncbi:S26 family signal peptidase [Leptothoe sp. PORK10 BA2]|uniref:S26 family signal peptidase n=1 Tax=Leptothoe sp. PORK10 BA2 TaxID=3110254 RepID=UPI002B205F91|nr:S26 family signal peptidase [Leptothoe sp. PORK10 BA2]MEA5466335.1 S26 family signal peptidase [Leptothoe sp. PORK10 BA2]
MGQCLPRKLAIPEAGWGEYLQWFVGRRRRFVVRETSMVPTLRPGDTVLAAMGAEVQLGDIAIATHPLQPNMLLIKRVQEIFYDGSVYLISDNTTGPSVLDSRHFGVFTASTIIGRVTSRLATAPS